MPKSDKCLIRSRRRVAFTLATSADTAASVCLLLLATLADRPTASLGFLPHGEKASIRCNMATDRPGYPPRRWPVLVP